MNEQIKVVECDALQANEFYLIDVEGLKRKARWVVYPDHRMILEYNGNKIFELCPIEIKLNYRHEGGIQ